MNSFSEIVNRIRSHREANRGGLRTGGGADEGESEFGALWSSRVPVFTIALCLIALVGLLPLVLAILGKPSLLKGPPPVTPAAMPTPPAAPARLPCPEIETGDFSGTITFDGIPPAPGVLVAAAPPVPAILDESLLVDPKKGGIANVLVYAEKLPAGICVPPAPKVPVTVSITGGVFVPHAVFVQTGQTVSITNNDPTLGNVHTFPLRNDGLNATIASKAVLITTYAKPEKVPIPVKSDLQVWMMSYQLVLDHPWGAITDKNGAFTITGLPPGKYSFKVWHERVGYIDRALAVEIEAGKATEKAISVPKAKFVP